MEQHGTVQHVSGKHLDSLRLVVFIWWQGDESQTVFSREGPLGLERGWKKSDAGRVHGLEITDHKIIN